MASPTRFAPSFRVAINDEELPAALRGCIASISYQDGLNGADRVEIGIANTDLRWLQEHIRGLGVRPYPTGIKLGPVHTIGVPPTGLFDIDNKLTLALGYAPDPPEELFLGEITGLEAEFPTSGMPLLKLVAHDYLHRLGEGSHARGFGPLPDFVIAAILGAENLLIPLIDPVVAAESAALLVLSAIFQGPSGRKQKAQSDLKLLKEIADQYDADFWVEGDALYLSRVLPKEYEPRLTLTWGQSLLEFAPRVTTIGQVVGVGVRFSLQVIPIDLIVTVAWDFDREALAVTVLPCEASAVNKNPVFTLVKRPLGSPLDVVSGAMFLIRELRNKLNNRLTGEGTAVGDPRLRAGAMIRLDGLGPDFSGNYRVVSATHTLDHSGYLTQFKVRKEIIP